MRKKVLLLLVFALLLGILSGCTKPINDETSNARQEGFEWPTDTIEVVVPGNPGGDTDFNARTMAKYFEKATGVTMIITNMPGAGGSIATSHVKESKNDGSIMLFSHIGQLIVNQVTGVTDYGIEAFEICCIPAVERSSVFAVRADSGITSIKDLVEVSQQREIVYGAEFGSTTHIQGLVLADVTGAKLKIVDAGDAAEKITNILGGRVDLISIPYGTIQDHISTGDLVAIAQLSGTKNELLPDIPTVAEQGYNFAMEKPYIAAFPKGTDKEFVEKVAKVIEEIQSDPGYIKELEETYKQPVGYFNGEDAVALLNKIRDDYMKYKDLLK